jgi:hypothetical protein
VRMDRYIQALMKLCDTHGGYAKIAETIGANAQTIYQIVSGVKLPSGNPRGVGPQLRKKLEAHFPLWLDDLGPQRPGSTFDAITPDEAKLLDDFRAMTDDDQIEITAEIRRRADKARAYLKKMLKQLGITNGD